MNKKIINTSSAPAPIGPYSQAVLAGGTLFISGQIAIKPGTADMITGDIKSETEQVMDNINAILSGAGLTFSNVVKTTIFITDMSFFSAVNEVYGKYFDRDFPARETVAVKELPKNVHVEISMIATV
jgi:2-iminobutanoate/2-iminopropanoate deaminase